MTGPGHRHRRAQTSMHEWLGIAGAGLLAAILAANMWDMAAIAIVSLFIFEMGKRDERDRKC